MPDLTLLTPHDFRNLAAARLRQAAPDVAPFVAGGEFYGPSDFDLNPKAADVLASAAPRPASVLVPIIARDRLTVLLTERTPHLSAHAGQIAFPGGKPDPEDSGPVVTALREAEEEIGLDRSYAEPLGFLDLYRTSTGFAVTPVVALIRPEFSLTLNTHEAASAFEVPLSFLMDPANHHIHAHERAGHKRHYYAMPYRERYIWGATAGMLRNMQGKLFAP